jgi:hypothetical protein
MNELTPEDMEWLANNPSGSTDGMPDNVKNYFLDMITEVDKQLLEKAEENKKKQHPDPNLLSSKKARRR